MGLKKPQLFKRNKSPDSYIGTPNKELDKLFSITSIDTHITKIDYTDSDDDEMPPLFKAILKGSENEIMAELIESTSGEVDLNKIKYSGYLPLHFCCRKRNMKTIKLLLDKGAKVDMEDDYGNTALHVAVVLGWPEGVNILLASGAPPSQLSKQSGQFGNGKSNQNTLLHSLLARKDVKQLENKVMECAQLLINGGLNIDTCNHNGETFIYLAAKADLSYVVAKLLEMGANPGIRTINKSSTLHAACMSGSDDSLSCLLNSNLVIQYITEEDIKKQSPFHLAVEKRAINCCYLLLQHGDHLMNKDSKSRTRCQLLNSLPSAPQFLKKHFDECVSVSSDDLNDPDFHVKFDYNPILRNTKNIQVSIISDIVKSDDGVLEHPLVESFLAFKWGCVKPLFYIRMMLYLVFVIIHTWYILTTYGKHNKIWANSFITLICFRTVYIVLFLSFLIPDLLFMLLNWRRYFSQWETYCKLVAIGTAAFIMFSPRVYENKHLPIEVEIGSDQTIHFPKGYMKDLVFIPPIKSDNINPELIVFPDDNSISDIIDFPFSGRIGKTTSNEHSVIKNTTSGTYVPLETYAAAVSGFFSWLEFMMIMGKVPSLGIYILIFNHVAKSLITFVFAFSSLLIGFALTFHLLFRKLITFNTMEDSIIKTMVMVIGEIDYADMTTDLPMPIFSKIFIVIFLFLVPVLMANLLIGMTIEDIPALKRKGKYMRLASQASYLASYENLVMLLKKLRCLPCYCLLSLFSKGSFKIPVIKEIFPNSTKGSKGWSLSNDIMKRAIHTGLEKHSNNDSKSIDSSSISSDFLLDFKHFQDQYYLDKQVLHKRLDDIYAAITKKQNSTMT